MNEAVLDQWEREGGEVAQASLAARVLPLIAEVRRLRSRLRQQAIGAEKIEAELRKENAGLMEELGEVRERLAKAEASEELTEAEASKARVELEGAEKRIALQDQKIEELDQEVSILMERRATTAAEISALENERDSWKDSAEAKSRDMVALQEEMAALQAQLEELSTPDRKLKGAKK